MRRFLLTLGLVALAVSAGAEPSAAIVHALAYNIPLRLQLITTGGGAAFTGGDITGATSFLDGTNFKIKNTADPTKILQFDASGITTGNTLSIALTGTSAAPIWNLQTANIQLLSNVFISGQASGRFIVGATAGASNGDIRSNSWTGASAGTQITDTTGVTFGNVETIGWASTGTVGTSDLVLGREAAATSQHGLDLNGAAIAQTDKACDGITGTDIAGCDYIHAGGRGTGIGAPGDIHEQTAKDLATGTTAQTLFDRHFYRGKAKALTESVATTFITFNIPTSLTAVGGEVRYCLHAIDGTDVQERCGDADFACVNKAGTVTASAVNLLGTEATAITTGTLTNTMTMVTSGTTCSMQANAVSSLTQTILDVRYSVEMQGSGTVTP